MNGWLIILALFATYRLTRMVTSDYVAEPLRTWAEKKWGKQSKRAYLLTCNWCFSMWVCPWPSMVAVWWPTNRVVWWTLIALSASAATGLIATQQTYVERTTPDEPEES